MAWKLWYFRKLVAEERRSQTEVRLSQFVITSTLFTPDQLLSLGLILILLDLLIVPGLISFPNPFGVFFFSKVTILVPNYDAERD